MTTKFREKKTVNNTSFLYIVNMKNMTSNWAIKGTIRFLICYFWNLEKCVKVSINLFFFCHFNIDYDYRFKIEMGTYSD